MLQLQVGIAAVLRVASVMGTLHSFCDTSHACSEDDAAADGEAVTTLEECEDLPSSSHEHDNSIICFSMVLVVFVGESSSFARGRLKTTAGIRRFKFSVLSETGVLSNNYVDIC